MSQGKLRPTQPQADDIVVSEPVGLDKVGADDATDQPDAEIAIALPIESGDFDAQTH